jgi:hypothetical protein
VRLPMASYSLAELLRQAGFVEVNYWFAGRQEP